MMSAPFGTWKSPIGADLITQKTITIAEVIVDAVTGAVYHVESRPYEAGRSVIVDSKSGTDVFGEGWNARSGVHEYGGASVAVRDGVIYFTDYGTKRLYKVNSPTVAESVTPENPNHRFGDFKISPAHSHLVVSILEDHTNPAPPDIVNTLVLVNAKTKTVSELASGADFYSSPSFSPNGKKISWIQWYHPDMPWEGSQLVLADLLLDESERPSLSNIKVIAGKKEEESINQPIWISDDVLVYLTDASGFYNPWRYQISNEASSPILPSPAAQEYAEPAWKLGASAYASLGNQTILASPTEQGVLQLCIVDVVSGKQVPIESSYVRVSHVHTIDENRVVFVGTKDDDAPALVLLTLPSDYRASDQLKPQFQNLKSTSSLASSLSSSLFPKPSSIELITPETKQPLYALYFPPTNPEYSGGKDRELPPCICNIHGGPTGNVPPGLNWVTTYFTSRGWAWVDVNYGGSSGYGRDYRERLRGNWGIVDVEDSVTVIEQLGARGLIDVRRVAIRGGSAGGFTVLDALIAKPTVFAAGTSSYGVTDLEMLARDTHKFESRYLEKLVGGTLEEVPEVYKARSPVHHAEKIVAPLLVLQGDVDAVVPPSQAEAIVEKIKKRGGKVEYILFEGEGHGWRKAETVKAALEKEESWYKGVFGLN
ncbi:hypothetical protein FRC02_002991 [Tulasnella sp. 418]|nr:hypothetical protein FRC02_002991 [Tulasnella sp. 418]